MDKVKKQCLVCNNEFEVCNRCNQNIDKIFQWRQVVCCPEHFYYHLAIISYVRGEITKSQAKKQLLDCIKNYGKVKFNDNIQKIVDEIMSNKITKK